MTLADAGGVIGVALMLLAYAGGQLGRATSEDDRYLTIRSIIEQISIACAKWVT